LYKTQNHVRDGLVADHGVQHGVINHASRPFNMEIFLNEIGTFAIDGYQQVLKLPFRFSAFEETLDFVFSRCIQKYAQHIASVFEELL